MIKWIPLKISNGAQISDQMDLVLKKYINLVIEVKRTQVIRRIKELSDMDLELNNRLKEFEKFYANNSSDERISKFEKIISKIKKTLKYRSEINNKTNTEASEFNLDRIETITSMNNNNNSASPEKRGRPHSTENKNRINTNASNNNKNNLNEVIDNNNNLIDNKNTEEKSGPSFAGGLINISSKMKKNPNEELIDWKEIVFKIKLTEPEYKLLLKEKSKNVINFK